MTTGPARVQRQLAWVLAICLAVPLTAAYGAGALTESVATVSSGRVATDRPCPPAAPPVAAPRLEDVSVTAVAVGRAEAPTTMALVPGRDDGVLGERAGRLVAIVDGAVTHDVVLDRRGDTSHDGDGGLLGAAYDPRGDWLYVYRATRAQDDVLTAYPVDDSGRPRAGDERELLRVDHPTSQQHHGGALHVDSNGLLYVGLGDGGGLGDPLGRAQDPSTLLGKVLRIEPTPAAEEPYRIPADNPFRDRPGWRPEIWVLGVRNPFRFGPDAATGELWLGDVGQSCWEELDRLSAATAGANLGWDRREGRHDFERGELAGRALEPVHEHPHRSGWCAIVAGYVPRDSPIPALDGWLLHTDYCAGRVLALRAPERTGGQPALRDLGLQLESPAAIVSGPSGLPWVLSLEGDVLELRPT